MNDNQLKTVSRYNPTAIGTIFVGAVLLAIEISTLINQIKLSLFPLVVFMAIVFIVVTIIVLVIAIRKLKVTLYEVHCPYCGNVTHIDTTKKHGDCEVCHYPIIIKDNKASKVISDIKESDNCQQEGNIMIPCVKCKKQIPNDSIRCPHCGESQPFTWTRDDIPKKPKAQEEKVEDNINHLEAAILESERGAKRKKRNIIIAVVASTLVIVSIIVSIVLSNNKLEIDRAERIAQRNSISTEATDNTESSSGVNGKGYYHFDNDFDTTIANHLVLIENEFDNEISTALEPKSVSDFSIVETTTLLGENVTQYYYQYYGGKTAVSFYINSDNEISAFSFHYLLSMADDITTTDTYKQEQLGLKPARWLHSLNSNLSESTSIDIYKSLMLGVADAIDGEKCSYYYDGYTMVSSSSDTTQILTVLKTDRNFAEKNNIKVGGTPLFSKITVESETVSAKDDRKTYFTDYSVVLPDDWTYEDHGDSVDFHSKYSYENDIQENLYGRIFTIEKTKLTESDYMEAVKLLGTKDGYNYFVVYPMGMGVSKDEKANQTHSAALAEQDDVIKSFELISTTNKGNDTESSTKFSSDPNEIIEESPQYGKLRFTFTYKELYSRQQNALTKLGLKGFKQYDWDLDDLQISDEHYKWSHEDLETMLYQYICKDESYYWWEHIYCTKYEESDLVRGFEIFVKSRQGADQITVIKNIVKISLLMVNPNLTAEQAESAMSQLYNSPDSFNTDRCMYYNGVFYRLAGKEDFTGVVVKPMTESDYQKSIDKKNTN